MSAELEKNQGILEAALEIQERRANTKREIRTLLLNGEDQKALRLMRKYLGISETKLKLVANK